MAPHSLPEVSKDKKDLINLQTGPIGRQVALAQPFSMLTFWAFPVLNTTIGVHFAPNSYLEKIDILVVLT